MRVGVAGMFLGVKFETEVVEHPASISTVPAPIAKHQLRTFIERRCFPSRPTVGKAHLPAARRAHEPSGRQAPAWLVAGAGQPKSTLACHRDA